MSRAWGGIELGEIVEKLARNVDIDMFTVDAEGSIGLASTTIGDKIGCGSDLRGRKVAEALSFLRDLDSGESFAATLGERVLARGETRFLRSFHFHSPGGEDRQADLMAFPIRGDGAAIEGAIVVVHDTTTEERLRSHLESILQSTEDGVFVLNRKEEVVIFNRACEHLTGLKREDVLGGRLTCDEVFRCHRFATKHPEAAAAPPRPALPVVKTASGREISPCALSEIFREHKEKAREEAVLVSRSGERHWVETSFAPVLDASGAVRYTVGVLRIIDDRKRAEQEVTRKNAELERTMAELGERSRQLIHAEKMASIGQLAAGIAHELNTPLNTILGYAQLILKQVREPAIVEEVEAIEAATKRCRATVQSVLDFSRKSDGFRAPRRINRVIGRAFSFLKHDLERRGVATTLALDRAPYEVVADESQLEQVFLNLASNAMDAMPEGGRIMVRTARRGDRIAIEFSDTGAGIPPEVLPRIFEPFFTTKVVGKGTGLGLSIAARIIEEHAGSIEVESEPGKGTAFRILLPLHNAAGAPSAATGRAP